MRRQGWFFVTVVLSLGGYNQSTVENPSAAISNASGVYQFNLDEEPSGAIGVIELRESAKDGESVVVVGLSSEGFCRELDFWRQNSEGLSSSRFSATGGSSCDANRGDRVARNITAYIVARQSRGLRFAD